MGNATSVTIRNSSSIYEWVKSRFSSSGNSGDVNAATSGSKPNGGHRKGKSTKYKQDTSIGIPPPLPDSETYKGEVSQNLQDLLTSLTTEENIQKLLHGQFHFDDDIYFSRFVQGTVAEAFYKYLNDNNGKAERKIEKFYFLLLTEIVLACKNKKDQRKVFDQLTSLFFSANGKLKDSLKLSNAKLGDKLYSYTLKNEEKSDHELEEDAIKFLKKAKLDGCIWQGDRGLVPIYMDFHHYYSQKTNICACLLSIL